MPRGRTASKTAAATNVGRDAKANLFDDVDEFAERLDVSDVEMLTGYRPTHSASRSGELQFSDND